MVAAFLIGMNKPRILKNAIPSYGWMKRYDYQPENQAWIGKAIQIAVKILDILEEKNVTQTQLAKKMGVSKQQVTKIIKAEENMTLKTLSKIEEALGIKLGKVMDGPK